MHWLNFSSPIQPIVVLYTLQVAVQSSISRRTNYLTWPQPVALAVSAACWSDGEAIHVSCPKCPLLISSVNFSCDDRTIFFVKVVRWNLLFPQLPNEIYQNCPHEGSWNLKFWTNASSQPLFAWSYLAYKPWLIRQRTVFFSHTKLANSTFSHGL